MKPQLSKWQKKHLWTDDEKRLLIKLGGKIPVQEIAMRLNKSNMAVRSAATKLGVSIKHPDNVRP